MGPAMTQGMVKEAVAGQAILVISDIFSDGVSSLDGFRVGKEIQGRSLVGV